MHHDFANGRTARQLQPCFIIGIVFLVAKILQGQYMSLRQCKLKKYSVLALLHNEPCESVRTLENLHRGFIPKSPKFEGRKMAIFRDLDETFVPKSVPIWGVYSAFRSTI